MCVLTSYMLFIPAKPLEILDFETCLKEKRLNLLVGQNLYMFMKILQTQSESVHFIPSISSLKSPGNSEFRVCILHTNVHSLFLDQICL